MSGHATKDDVQEIVTKAVDKAVDDLSEVIGNLVQQVDARFSQIENTLDEQDKKFDKLLNTIDGFIGRIDQYEAEQAARDSQFNRLLDWARKVSVKTGIPLENL